MNQNTISLRERVEKLYDQDKFDDILVMLTVEQLEKEKDAALYAWKALSNQKMAKDISLTIFFAEKAIAQDPNFPDGYFARASAWDEKNANDKAIADYSKAIEINPEYAEAYYKRGIDWLNINENDKALADFDKSIDLFNKAIKQNPNNAQLYINTGNAWYYKQEYGKAIEEYTKAIQKDFYAADAHYNRGLAWFAKRKYGKAISEYNKVIKLKPNYADVYYNERGIAWKKIKKYDKAIADYTKAIDIKPNFENAYYNRGLAKKEENVDLEGSKRDFGKYLELVNDKSEVWIKYAKNYMDELDILIKDPNLRLIKQLVDRIKERLLIKEKCITHYTSLSVLKSLLLDNSKFRISEGNFMNDPSEGKEFLNFLNYVPISSRKNGNSMKTYSPKPFIGSFVTKEKNDDLSLWRFYGKDKGVEAKGCAITLRMQVFIDNIENWLLNEKKEARQVNETDINCYRVVYIGHEEQIKFYIPNSDKIAEVDNLMKELKDKVTAYKGDYALSLENYLNSIAYLFKSDAYKNENEVRLVVKGIEFEKEYYMDISSPRVYIELVPIKEIVSQITLGPKVDKVSEWIAAFNYSYKDKAPKVVVSRLPYK